MLPELVVRLISATAGRITSINFPVGDAVSDEGWDGVLDCVSTHSLIPDGISGWEIGTNKSAPGKAKDDYEKREIDPLELSPADTTFVFVTPRSWPTRASWSAQKHHDGHWKNVKVIGASDLALWLRDAPVVDLWLARHLGIAPAAGLTDLEGWWREWSLATTPSMTPAMLVCGRDNEAAFVQTWMSKTSTTLNVQADAPDEALAFLYASLSIHLAESVGGLGPKIVVAETEEAFRTAAAWTTPHVIAAPADIAASLAGAAVQGGHKVYLAVSRKISVRGEQPLRLGRLDAAELEEALILGGYAPDKAKRVVWECGRSIPVLRRRNIARNPAWAEPGSGPQLIPALMCSAWSEHDRPTVTFAGEPTTPLRDRMVVGLFAQSNYSAASTAVRHWAGGDDPPLRRVDPVWKLTAPVDAWFLLSRYVEQEHFDCLKRVAVEVFSTLDPKYELPEDKQWSATIYGKQPPFSEWIKEGLAQTLATIANYSEQLSLSIVDGLGYVHTLMQSVYYGMNTWQAWASIDEMLPTLAEAAPTALLAGLERFTTQFPEEIRILFSDVNDGMIGQCRHVGMLWALERMAWSPKYLFRACALLARLDELDPGGRWANRPRPSLRDILAWPEEPYTYANLEQRLMVIDHLLVRYPETAWALLLVVVESFRSRAVRTPPHVRDFRPEGWQPDSPSEVSAYCEAFLSRLMAATESGPISCLVDLINRVDQLPGAEQTRLARYIEKTTLRVQGQERVELARALQHFQERLECGHLASTPTVEFLEVVRRTAPLLEDQNLVAQLGTWFSDSPPRTPGIPLTDWEARENAVTEKRRALVARLLNDVGLLKTVTAGCEVQRRWEFGCALAACVSADNDVDLQAGRVPWPATEPGQMSQMLGGYAAGKYQAEGETWLAPWLDSYSSCSGGEEVCATLLLVLPPTSGTWQRVSSFGAEVERLYWSRCHGIPSRNENAETVSYALEKLCSADRAYTALQIVSQLGVAQLPGPILIRVADAFLDETARKGTAHLNSMTAYYTEHLFRAMDICTDVPDADLLRLEWSYLRVLEHTDRGLRALHSRMARDPEWFVHFVSEVWPPDEKSPTPVDEQARGKAGLAYALLSNWSSPFPGQSDAGIDSGALQAWVMDARRLFLEAGLKEIGDDQIGKILSASPPDPRDGLWPHQAVREVLEQIPGEIITKAFQCGKYNRRGVHTRSLTDGGKQERALAHENQLASDRMHNQWPRTADVLTEIAAGYLRDAKHQDDDVERRKL